MAIYIIIDDLYDTIKNYGSYFIISFGVIESVFTTIKSSSQFDQH